MKKLLGIAVIGFALLGLFSGVASAYYSSSNYQPSYYGGYGGYGSGYGYGNNYYDAYSYTSSRSYGYGNYPAYTSTSNYNKLTTNDYVPGVGYVQQTAYVVTKTQSPQYGYGYNYGYYDYPWYQRYWNQYPSYGYARYQPNHYFYGY